MALSSKESPLIIWAGDIEIDGHSDGAINMKDIVEIIKLFNTIPRDAEYNAGLDFNKDNAINLIDIVIVLKHFNTTSNDYNKK